MFCISSKLALTWAYLGIDFDVVASFGRSHLVKLRATR